MYMSAQHRLNHYQPMPLPHVKYLNDMADTCLNRRRNVAARKETAQPTRPPKPHRPPRARQTTFKYTQLQAGDAGHLFYVFGSCIDPC